MQRFHPAQTLRDCQPPPRAHAHVRGRAARQVGDDVVFGSRSIVRCADATHAARVRGSDLYVSAASAGTLARRPPAVCGSNIRGYIAFLAIASWFATARANRTFDACSEA